jgi:O-antigen ligase
LIVTFTRSAWLGMLASAAVMLALWRARWIAVLVATVAIAVSFAPPEYKERLASIVDPQHEMNIERTYMWTAGLLMFRDRPITGVGLQNLKPVYERYRPPEAKQGAGHLHSVPIHVAATMGTVGLVALVLLFIGLFRCAGSGLRTTLRAVRRARGPDDEPRRLAAGLRLGMVGALAGFVVSGWFEWNLGDEELLYPLYVLTGLAWAARAWPPPSPTLVERARRVLSRLSTSVKRRLRPQQEPPP